MVANTHTHIFLYIFSIQAQFREANVSPPETATISAQC